MTASGILGIVFALTSALSWGAGDFGGGVVTRSRSQFQSLFLITVPGIVVLALLSFLVGEPALTLRDISWATAAGLFGALGISSLYLGLSKGNAATVSPAAGVIGAALPVAFSFLFIGMPGALKLAGFAAAIAGIWFVSRPDGGFTGLHRQGLFLAVIAGTGFGLFFVLLAQVRDGLVFAPLVFSKFAALAISALILFRSREGIPSLTSSPLAISAGVFDAGGNAFYMLARQFTRLDVAAVLSSMYPAFTVILSCIILKERVSSSQWAGVALCMFAIVLISV